MTQSLIPEEAFIGILATAIAADNKFANQELQLIDLISKYHCYTRSLSSEQLKDIIARVRDTITNSVISSVLDMYCLALPKEWRGTVFLCALDLIYIDGEAHQQEEFFIERIAANFGLELTSVDHFRSVFREKNGIVS
jgi:uncharacterized tellurite resistance protein B-like protein